MTAGPELLVVGAGLSGLASAVGLARLGVRVRVCESKPTRADLVTGRPSINLTLGVRGRSALEQLGLGPKVTELGVSATVRHIHQRSGEVVVQPYGSAGEAILSVRRNDLVSLLLDRTESDDRISVRFDERVIRADEDGSVTIRHGADGPEEEEVRPDFVIGADGLNSRVRKAICEITGSPGSRPTSAGVQWLEVRVPTPWAHAGSAAVDVWPRDPLMLIAFPNRDGARTVLLFAPVGQHFPTYEGLVELVPDLRVDREDYLASVGRHDEVRVVQCPRWQVGRLCLIGDAAHAMTPYLGQGANAALADACELVAVGAGAGSWSEVGARFEARRRPETECLARLASEHYVELSHHMGDRTAALRRDLRLLLGKYFPGQFQPIYNRVAFSSGSLLDAERDHAAEEPKLAAIMGAVRQEVGSPSEEGT